MQREPAILLSQRVGVIVGLTVVRRSSTIDVIAFLTGNKILMIAFRRLNQEAASPAVSVSLLEH
jgi:hypothetical protein